MRNTSGPPIIYILQILCNINEFETSQLNLRRLELSATMLKIVKYMMTLKVAKNNYLKKKLFHNFAACACKENWHVIFRQLFVSLIVDR